jgi:hypothetical protein
MKVTEPNLNLLLLRSVPLDKDLKRYFISKYRHLVRCNGIDFANDKIKHLLSSLKTYKASGDLPSLGIRRSGWVRKLIVYTDCQPHHVFAFLKGLTSWKSEIDVSKTSRSYHVKLSGNTKCHDTPSFLRQWIRCVKMTKEELYLHYWDCRKGSDLPFSKFARHHPLDDWFSYWFTWKRNLKHSFELQPWMEKPAFPELYKKYEPALRTDSTDLERDLVNFLAWLNGRSDVPQEPPPEHLVEYLLSYMSNDIYEMYRDIRDGDIHPLRYSNTDKMSGVYVGDIHYIPKAGTGYRPIAVPNRLIQQGLVPLYRFLSGVLRQLPNDCTFDQGQFDSVIQSRVTTDSRFIGSVDLTAATDYLPMSWLDDFVSSFLPNSEKVRNSLELFQLVSRSKWSNDGYMSEWLVGQPLGTLPSFSWLGLTHNLYLESLSLELGLGHSPYRVLGDDVVIFSKRLHRSYIRTMANRGIPLSLSKSYSGKLTEFAGKTFVKRCNPFLNPDHNLVTWSSLFDWQYSTGIRIPWHLLPRRIKSKITRLTGKLALSGQQCYELVQYVTVPARGSTSQPLIDSQWDDMLVDMWLQLEEETLPEEHHVLHTGAIHLQDRVGVISRTPLEMGGYFRRYYQTRLPEWFRRKFRPATTDRLFSVAKVAAENARLKEI